jgi:hypothetical protein
VLDEDERALPVVPAAPAPVDAPPVDAPPVDAPPVDAPPVDAPLAELDPDAGEALARMKPPWELAPPAADPAVLPAPVLPEPLADWRHPLIVTVFEESPCDCLVLLPDCPLCPDPDEPDPDEVGGCCAAVPTARTAVSIVPKIN